MYCMSGYQVIFNHQNFEWNKSEFGEKFKNTTTAGDFVNVWNKVTRLHESGWLAEPIVGDVGSPDNSFDSSQESALSATATKRPSTNPDVTVPPSKRVASSPHLQPTDSTHANPIDDRILSKRKGTATVYVTMFILHALCSMLSVKTPSV